MVKGGFSLNSRRTVRGPPNHILTTHNSKAKVIWKSFELDTNASQACHHCFWNYYNLCDVKVTKRRRFLLQFIFKWHYGKTLLTPAYPDLSTQTNKLRNLSFEITCNCIRRGSHQHDDEDFAWQYQGTALMNPISERLGKKSYFFILSTFIYSWKG